ncbi:MAG: CehA/McbA family metallohydrolase, partial [Planctomycetaceae bacterium]
IGETWATPPYRPGPLGAGRWHLLLGPYKIGPNGLDYEARFWFDPSLQPHIPDLEPIPAPSVRRLPELIEPGWVRGDVHTHSVASDGDSTLPELLQAAKDAGLDFLGSTDHHAAILPSGNDDPDLPVLIPGIEVTTYKGHWNVWGADRWFDFRLPDGESVRREIKAAIDAGGFVSMNHPKPFGPLWEYGFGLGYQAIEVWNGFWPALNATSLGVWDLHLATGQRVVAMGGSDTHFLRGEETGKFAKAELGQPSMWVKPEDPRSAVSILAELRAGRSFITAGPEGPQILIDVPERNVLRVRTASATGLALQIISSGKVIAATAVDSDRWTWELTIPAGLPHLRAQLTDAQGNVEALSNALWFAGQNVESEV